jgi:hypothetical protein
MKLMAITSRLKMVIFLGSTHLTLRLLGLLPNGHRDGNQLVITLLRIVNNYGTSGLDGKRVPCLSDLHQLAYLGVVITKHYRILSVAGA